MKFKLYSHEIDIQSDEIKKQCIDFWNQLNDDYKKFKSNWEVFNNEYEKYKNKMEKEIFFTPENVVIKSPITIFDAPWGIGKTYFLENVCKLIKNNEIQLTKIKKVIMIDSFRFSACDSIPDELISELFSKFIKDDNKKTILKSLSWFYNVCAKPWINNFLKIDLDKIENKEESREEAIEELNKIVDVPTLVIIDNVERIGKDCWEIIKSIQKLTLLDNFIFLFPLNKSVLNNTFKNENGEWTIEKYISLPYYEFKQDYTGILKKYNFNDEYAKFANNYLQNQINNETLTIRELQNNIKNFEIKNNDLSKINCLEILSKFWNHKDKKFEIISNIIDEFINNLNEISNFIYKLINEIYHDNEIAKLNLLFNDIYNFEEIINISNNYLSLDNYINKISSMDVLNIYDLDNIDIVTKNLKKCLLILETNIKNDIENSKSRINQIKEEIEKIEENKKELENNINKLSNKNKQLENQEKNVKNSDKLAENELRLKKYKESLNKNEESKEELNNEKDNYKEVNELLIEISKISIDSINNLISKLEKINELINNIDNEIDYKKIIFAYKSLVSEEYYKETRILNTDKNTIIEKIILDINNIE